MLRFWSAIFIVIVFGVAAGVLTWQRMVTPGVHLLGQVGGTPITWDGEGLLDNWSDAANWNPDGVPTSLTDVNIGAGANVVVDTNAWVKIFTMNSNTVVTLKASNGRLNVAGDFNFGGGTFVGEEATSLDVKGSLNVAPVISGQFTAPPSIVVGKTFYCFPGSAFVHNSGNVSFANGCADMRIEGSCTFYNLTIANALGGDCTISFTGQTTTRVAHQLQLTGYSESSPLKVRSTMASTQHEIDVPEATYSNLDVKDSKSLTSDLSCTIGCNDSGNNTRWIFGGGSCTADGCSCSNDSDCSSGFCCATICAISACGGGSGSCGDGTVNGSEQCDGEACCTGSCTYQASSSVCRATAGTCDIEERCSGSSASCPVDTFQSATTVCRAVNGACDDEEKCSGTSVSCPSDGFHPNTFVCSAAVAPNPAPPQWPASPANGRHQVRCTGTSITCPAPANGAPAITAIPNQVTVAGAPVSFQLSATDPDGDAIAFKATGLPQGLTLTSTAKIVGSPVASLPSNTFFTSLLSFLTQAGGTTHTVTIDAADGFGGVAAPRTFTWTVNPSGPPPTSSSSSSSNFSSSQSQPGSQGSSASAACFTLTKRKRTAVYSSGDHACIYQIPAKFSGVLHRGIESEVPPQASDCGGFSFLDLGTPVAEQSGLKAQWSAGDHACIYSCPKNYALLNIVAEDTTGSSDCNHYKCRSIGEGGAIEKRTAQWNAGDHACVYNCSKGYALRYFVAENPSGPSDCNTFTCQQIANVCPVLPECSDGLDNDGDGKIDFPSDPGCTSADDNDEQDTKACIGDIRLSVDFTKTKKHPSNFTLTNGQTVEENEIFDLVTANQPMEDPPFPTDNIYLMVRRSSGFVEFFAVNPAMKNKPQSDYSLIEGIITIEGSTFTDAVEDSAKDLEEQNTVDKVKITASTTAKFGMWYAQEGDKFRLYYDCGGPLPECSDGVDNDGDGFIDFPSDPGCTDGDDDDEADEPDPPMSSSSSEQESSSSSAGRRSFSSSQSSAQTSGGSSSSANSRASSQGSGGSASSQNSSTPTHMVCQNNQCVSVQGPGADQCLTQRDCARQDHLECSASKQCITMAGPGTDLCNTSTDCSGGTHAVCFGNSCAQDSGPGTDQCSTNSDCTRQDHLECQNNQCVTAPGPGIDLCVSSSQCTQTHTICFGNACVQTPGPGTNLCSTNSDCTNAQHFECNNLKQCEQVSGPGADQCTTNSNCAPNPTHMVCQNNQCVTIQGSGTNECATNSNCAPSPTHLICQNQQCLSVQGQSANECTTNSNCFSNTHLVCVNNQCVSVQGAAANECSNNDNCFSQTHLACVNNQCTSVQGQAANECTNTTNCFSSTHVTCVNNQCVSVQGAAANECTNNANCSSNTHLACVNNQCVGVQGAAANECTTNSNCINDQHLECNNLKQCEQVLGPGANQCLTNANCIVSDHLECNLSSQCITIPGPGINLCNSNPECNTTHSVCFGSSCAQAPGPGVNQCSTNDHCTGTDHLECTPSKQCILTPGPGQDLCTSDAACTGPIHLACFGNMCTIVPGPGSNLCSTNTDCSPPTHGVCSGNQCEQVLGPGANQCLTNAHCASPTHLECNLSSQCITIPGPGINLCNSNPECNTTHSVCFGSSCAQAPGPGVNQCSTNDHCTGTDHLECTPSKQCILTPGPGQDLCTSDAACTGPILLLLCGNGTIDVGEECDQSSRNSNTLADHCRLTCRLPSCGDGVTDTSETCDDGNVRNNDGCSSSCREEEALIAGSGLCGNGVLEPGEACDDGNTFEEDACAADCKIPASFPCNGSTDCASGRCQETCVGFTDATVCRQSGQCASGRCSNGVCVPKETRDASPEQTMVAGVQQQIGFPAGLQWPQAMLSPVNFPPGSPSLMAQLGWPYSVASQQPMIMRNPPAPPRGDTGPAAVVVMAGGAAAGMAWVRRRRSL